MNIIKEIRKKGDQKDFCKELNIHPQHFKAKIKVFENKVKWLDKFLKPLGKKVKIVDVEGK